MQAQPALVVKASEGGVLSGVLDDAVTQRAPLGGELDDLHATVGGVGHAADQATLLQPVNHRCGGRGIALQAIGKSARGHLRPATQPPQRIGLGIGQPRFPGQLLEFGMENPIIGNSMYLRRPCHSTRVGREGAAEWRMGFQLRLRQ